MALYKNGITLKELVSILELTTEYETYKKTSMKWSYAKILEKCKEIVNQYGYLPPAE